MRKLVSQTKKIPSRDELLVLANNKMKKISQEVEGITKLTDKTPKHKTRLNALHPSFEVWENFYDMLQFSTFDMDMLLHWARISSEKTESKKIPQPQREWMNHKAQVWEDISKLLE